MPAAGPDPSPPSAPPPVPWTKLRFNLHYAVMFCVIGVMLPFWPLWLEHQGLDPWQIGLAVGLTVWVKPLINPLVGHVADSTGRIRRVMAICAGCSALGFMALPTLSGFVLILAGTFVAAGGYFAVLPLSETKAIQADRAGWVAYGPVRLWGSLSFIAASTGAGYAIGQLGINGLPWSLVAITLLMVATSLALPPSQPRPATTAASVGSTAPAIAEDGMRGLLRNRQFMLFLFAAGAVHGSHAVLNGFATIHWIRAGLSEVTIGLLWAEGVVAEVILFAYAAMAMRKLGATGLLVAGAVCGILRWPLLALSTEPSVLIIAQILHAGTYGATHLAAMAYIAKHIPHHLTARAQSLYSGISLGLCIGPTMILAGPLYESYGGGAFWGSAALCVLGLVMASTDLRSNRTKSGPI